MIQENSTHVRYIFQIWDFGQNNLVTYLTDYNLSLIHVEKLNIFDALELMII